MFSSHEGLLLLYEEALTRKTELGWYNLGAHFLWIGDRTRQLDGAHIGAGMNGRVGHMGGARGRSTRVGHAGGARAWGGMTRVLPLTALCPWPEYFRGLANPIGIKVGPSMRPDELVAVLKRLNPTNEEGKVTLIARYGADKVCAGLVGQVKVEPSLPDPLNVRHDKYSGHHLPANAHSRGEGGPAQRPVVLRSHAWQHGDHRLRREDTTV